MEIKMEFDDNRSQIVFVIHVNNHNLRLNARFQPSISSFRTKSSLYKFWCHEVSNCTPPLPLDFTHHDLDIVPPPLPLDFTHHDLDLTTELTKQEIRCFKVFSLNDSQY